MSHNNYVYPVWTEELHPQMVALGYAADIESMLVGELLTGDNQSQDKPIICNDVPIPDFLNPEDYPFWPFNTHKQVLTLTKHPEWRVNYD